MYRSTTPELIFHVTNEDIDMSKIAICHVTVESADYSHKIIYENPEIDVENRLIKQFMTQAETLSFNAGTVLIQLKVKLENGSVIPSKIMTRSMKEILEEAEL